MEPSKHDHQHTPNRFGVIPTSIRLDANPKYTGKGVAIAFLDSGFYPHPDLLAPLNRIIAGHDVTGEPHTPDSVESWQWHGTQTTVVAAGNGHYAWPGSMPEVLVATFEPSNTSCFDNEKLAPLKSRTEI